MSNSKRASPLFATYEIEFGNTGKEGGMYVSPVGDLYIGRGGAVLRMLHNSRALEVFAGSVEASEHVDGTRMKAKFSAPGGMVFLEQALIVCDRSAHCIRAIDGDYVSTYAGTGKKGWKDGPKAETEWSWPNDVVQFRGSLYVADYGNNLIRVISPGGLVTSIGSSMEKSVDGKIGSPKLSFKSPFGLCVARETIYVTDQLSHSIRAIDIDAGQVTTLAGVRSNGSDEDAEFEEAQFNYPKGIDCTPDGDIIVADYGNSCICQLSLQKRKITLIASPNGANKSVVTNEPYFLALSPFGDLFWTTGSSQKLHCIQNLVAPFVELNWREEAIFSPITSLPSLCNVQLDFVAPSSPIQHLHLQTQLLRCIHPNLASTMFLERACNVAQPERLAEFFTMLHDLYLLETPAWSAFAVYIFDLAGLDAQTSPLMAWALQNFRSTLYRLHPLPFLFDLFIDIVQNMDGQQQLIQILSGSIRKMVEEKTALDPLHSRLAPFALYKPEIHAFAVQCLTSTDPKTLFVHTLDQGDIKTITPARALQQGLQDLAFALRFTSEPPSSSDSDANRPLSSTEPPQGNFKIAIERHVDNISQKQLYLLVHDWVMHTKWKYFARAISAGLVEAADRTLELPADFPPKLLLSIVQYMYSGRDFTPLESLDELKYLLGNGAQFEFLKLDGEPVAEFQEFVLSSRAALLKPLSSDSALTLLELGLELGNQAIAKEAMKVIGLNIKSIVTNETQHALIASLPNSVQIEIFDHFMKSLYN